MAKRCREQTMRSPGDRSSRNRGRRSAGASLGHLFSENHQPLSRHQADWLERRVLLSSAAIGAIPTAIDPTAAEQILLAPGAGDFVIPANASGGTSQLMKFALDGAAFDETVLFDLAPTATSPGSDAGLALYDQDGNLLASADADAVAGNPGVENLTAAIHSGQVYVLGVYYGPAGPPVSYTLTATTDAQNIDPAIQVDPGSGTTQSSAGQTTFDTPTDVNYYPLNLLNGGSGGTVTVTPTGLDVRVAATLFRRASNSEAWEVIDQKADATGNPVSLTLAPLPDHSLTDGEYLLAVAPVGFNSAARAYQVSVATNGQLGPATVSPATLGGFRSLPPVSVGQAEAVYQEGLTAGGSLFGFRAPATGLATLQLQTSAFDPVLSIYDQSGSNLLAVASRTTSGTLSISLPVTQGTAYIARVGDVGSDEMGQFTLTIDSAYVTQPLALAGNVTQTGPVSIGANRPGLYYRITPNGNTDVLAMELSASAPTSATVTVLGPNLPAVTRQITSGQRLFLPVDIAGRFGPVDLYIAGTGNDTSATVRIGQLDIPNQLSLNQLTPTKMGLNGDLANTQAAGAFGTLSGLQYYQLATATGQSTDVSVQGTAGAMPVLAHYREQGNILRLVDYDLPSETGLANLSGPLSADATHGIAAFSLGFDGGGNFGFNVAGPNLVGTGVGMVPDLTVTPPNYQSILQIRDVMLDKDYHQHLWRTILPLNMTALPTMRFEPASAGFRATVSVYLANGTLLASGTNTSGQALVLPITNANLNDLKGATLLFRAEPLTGQLGDGLYTLKMTAATSNPHPYEVTQTAWKFPDTNPTIAAADQGQVGTLPTSTIVRDVIQNQFGDGSIEGEFTSSDPYNSGVRGSTGTVDVYRFWAITPGPVSVRTVPIDPNVNTNIKIYQARFAADKSVSYLGQIPDVGPSRDWFPADRSQIDSEIYVNDFDALSYQFINHPDDLSLGNNYGDPYDTGGGFYYVVVMNEQGSKGRYRLEVDAPSFPLVGGANAAPADLNHDSYSRALDAETVYIPPGAGGSATIHFPFIERFPEFVGYYPIQLPDYHNNLLNVSSGLFNAWDFDAFDADGHPLVGSDVDEIFNTTGSWSVSSGPQTVYLRVKEQASNSATFASVTVSSALNLPAGVIAPPATLSPSLIARMLPTNPSGDGTVSDSFTVTGQVKLYEFNAGAGPLTVSVAPKSPSLQLRWGVYVNNTLVAWDQTQISGGTIDPKSTTTTILLPNLRPPLATPDYVYDTAEKHTVLVRVEAVGAPSASDTFTVTTDSASTLPLRNDDLAMNPLNSLATATLTTTGLAWNRLIVPDNINGAVDLKVDLTGIDGGGTQVRYDLYDDAGKLVNSATASTSIRSLGTVTFNDLPNVTGGRAYWLRVGVVTNAAVGVKVTATASLPKASPLLPNLKPPANQSMFEDPMTRLSPPPNGDQTLFYSNPFDASKPNLVGATAFWVGSAGMAYFSATFSGSPNAYLALYRGSVDRSKEFPSYNLDLVDYTNNFNANGSIFSLKAYVEPGMYVVKLVRSGGSGGGAVSFNLPDYIPIDLVQDPNSGDSSTLPMAGNDQARDGFGKPIQDLSDSWRTTFYRITTPVGSQGGATALAFSVPANAGGNVLENERATITVWRQTAGNNYQSYAGASNFIDPPTTPAAVIANPFSPNADEQFYIALDRRNLSSKIVVGAEFVVPESGTPDLVVDPIQLSPNEGQTHVDVNVRNIGYASVSLSHSLLAFIDASKSPGQVTTSQLLEYPIGPLGSRHRAVDWLPVTPQDSTSYTVDYDNKIAELDDSIASNKQSVILATVDPHAPVVSMRLADPQLDGNSDPNVWGRYVSGVYGVKTNVIIDIKDDDGTQDLYNAIGRVPYFNPPADSLDGMPFFVGAVSSTSIPMDFAWLRPTSQKNSNQFRLIARDRWGLPSAEVIKTAQVVQLPGWLDNADSGMEFDKASRRYKFHFRNALVDVHGTLDEITGSSIPFIGDLDNVFLAELKAQGSASLNPSEFVTAAVTAHAQITVLGHDVLNESYTTGNEQVSDHFSINSVLIINKLTLDTDALAVTFRLDQLPLFNIKSPKIPLFAYGIPEVAAISANLQFSVSAVLDAAVTLGIDPSVLQSPLQLPVIAGLLSPSFIAPSVTAGLSISGDVELLGFDIASIVGSVYFTLTPAYGLPTPQDQLIPFSDFFNTACLDVTGKLSGDIGAEFLGFRVFTFDLPTINLDFVNDCDIVRDSLSATLAALEQVTSGTGASDLSGNLNIAGGSAPVGSLMSVPRPNLVIDPSNGQAIYAQLVDVDPDPSVTRNNLAFARRTGNSWSGLTTLPTAGHVTNPVLALTNDRPNDPAVVVYQSYAAPGDPAKQTRNQFLTGQDIRYRYFDGTAWQSEQSLTNDSLCDTDQAVSFNSAGKGVAAWVHNTNPTPMAENGVMARSSQEIQVAVWNPVTHAFGAVTSLTADSIADSKPAVFAGEDGTLYVVWLRDTAGGNQVMYSRYNGSSWSTPAVLAIDGLPAGSKINSVAIGSEGPGRIDVLISDSQTFPDKHVESRLYNRPSTVAGFGLPAALEVVAENANFSNIRTLRAPDGALVAYWQQGDGISNEIYASRIGPSGSGPAVWSQPFRLTSSDAIERAPSVAIDSNGQYVVVYELPALANPVQLAGSQLKAPALPGGLPASGNIGANAVAPLPDFAFSRPLKFTDRSEAPSGTQVEADAQIVNLGTQADHVKVEYLIDPDGDAPPQVVSTQTLYLGPGQTYDLSPDFTVWPGQATYSVRLTAQGGSEAFSTADNTSSTILIGRAEIAAISLVPSNPEPNAGDTITLTATVQNLSTQPIGAFDVRLFMNDPDFANVPATVLSTQMVSGLGPQESKLVQFSWQVPAAGGRFTLTARADTANVIAEVTDRNNDANAVIIARPDAQFEGAVNTTVLNYSGVDNVQVSTQVRNAGRAPLINVPVQLLRSLDDGGFVDEGTVVIPSLPIGATKSVGWAAAGFAGVNHYRVIVDPKQVLQDADITNNMGDASLILQGLPDLTVSNVSVDPPKPTLGSTANVKARIANTGIASAENVLVEVFAKNQSIGKVLVGQTTLSKLDPLSSMDVSIPVLLAQLPTSIELSVVVDRFEQVLEVSDLNNEASIPVTLQVPGVFEGTAGDDRYYLRLDPAGTNVQVYYNAPAAPSGSPSFTYPLAALDALVFNTLGGNDELVVDFANGNPIPLKSGVSFNAGLDNDRLVILGSSQSENISITNTQALVGSRLIQQNGVEGITLNSGAGDDNVSIAGQAKVTLPANQSYSSLSIGGSASVALAPGSKLLQTKTLSITSQGMLDLNDGDMIVHSGDIAAISNLIKLGRNGGKWDSPGITSSAAKVQKTTGLAPIRNIRSNGSTILATFDNVNVGTADILVKYTWNGDVNLDGVVDAADYFLIDSGFITQQGQYRNGDLNFDGTVDASDYFLADSAFIAQTGVLAAEEIPVAPTADEVLVLKATPVAQPSQATSVLEQLFSSKRIDAW